MNNKVLIYMLALVATLFSCDSLEDTYKDFAGDGPIRYAGRCTDVSVKPGWECLRVNWTLSNDPTVKNIIVKCVSDGDTIRQELESDVTQTVISGLQNKNYTVTVQSLAADGALSLCESYTERPYTYEHETVLAFTRGVNKSFELGNHLLLFMGTWEDRITDFHIEYTSTDGKAQTFALTKDVFEEKYVDIDNVDVSHPVTLYRSGCIEGCPDVIQFQPYVFNRNVVMNSDFRNNMTERYGVDTDDIAAFADNQETVELDNSLFSFEDLLYFGKVKKVILGGNHFFNGKYRTLPTVDETERSQWVLTKLNEILGTEVEIYSNCYLDKKWNPEFVTRHGDAQLPELNYLPCEEWSISNSVSDLNDEDLVNLLDNDASTSWTSWPSTVGAREMALTIDMKKMEKVNGVKIVQAASTDTKNFQQGTVSLTWSADGVNFKPLSYLEENTIGKAMGEATLLKSPAPVDARYIKLVIKDVVYQGVVKVALADVAVY